MKFGMIYLKYVPSFLTTAQCADKAVIAKQRTNFEAMLVVV